MTRTDPPDILLSTVHRDLKVSPMPGEPKVYASQRKCDHSTTSALQDTQQYMNKRQCRSFDFLESLEAQQETGNSMEELPYRQPERRPASPETSWDSLGRQVYHRSSAPDLVVSRLCAYSAEHREVPKPESKRRLRSRSAPRAKTTFRPVPIEVSSPELMRRGRDALRMPRESQRRADTSPRRDTYYTSKYRMNEVHPIKLQPQRGEASHYPPLYVSENYESYEDNQAAKPHVRYRVDIKPDEAAAHHHQQPRSLKTPQTQAHVSNWHMQPGRSLTVPAGRRFIKTASPAESYGGDYWTLSTQSNYSPHRYYRRGAPQVVPPQPVFSEYNYPEVRRPFRQYGQPNVYYTEDSGRMSQQRYTSPMHFHDWWGTNRAAHPHQSYPTPQILSHWDGRVGSLSPHGSTYGIVDQQRVCTDTRSYSKSWDNILSPAGGGGGGHREFSVAHGLSYENLQQSPERRAPSPDGRRQPIVVNLSRSPKRYAALSLSESSIIEKVHGDGGRNTVGRSWYITPEITITDNDIRSNGLNRARFRLSGSRDAEGTDAGNSLSASFNDLLSCNADTARDAAADNLGYGSPHPQQQLDDVLADLVIDTCKTPASRRPSEADTLVDQLRKLITDSDSPAELDLRKGMVHTTEPQKMKGFPFAGGLASADVSREMGGHALGMLRSPSFPMASDGAPQDQTSDDVDTMMCSNLKCGLTETLFNARLYFKSCHSCYTYYCSRNCRKKDWEMHKECCVYGRVGSTCKRVLRICRENQDAHKAFSRIARLGYLSRGKGVLFLGFPNPGSAENFIQYGLESLVLAPTYLSVRELEGYADNLGEYSKEIQDAGKQYDPEECFLLNVSIALGQKVPENPSPRLQTPTVRRFAKISLASASPEKKVFKKDTEMETLILTPPPGTVDIDKEGEVGRKAREVCFINVQRELRIRGVFLRHEYPNIYQDLCEFVESNKRFTPTTIYPIDKRTGKQFMCMIMAASEPLTLDWVGKPNLLEDIM